MSKLNPQLLLSVKRGSVTEREHFGYLILADRTKVLKQMGNCTEDCFSLRSCQKPFQALPIVTSGAFDHFNFSLSELAICCASHAGSSVHTNLVKNILDKIGLEEKNLNCGVHAPLDKATKFYLKKNNIEPNQLHNNCSGKHTGMLSVCVHKRWDTVNYLNPNHLLQQEILKIVKKYCNLKNDPPICIDGCGAPVYAMPLYNMAQGFLNLFLSDEAKLLKQAFLQNPYVIGGNERLDTAIIEASGGTLIAKVGAEGLCVVVNPLKEQVLAVKIHDASMEARGIVVINALLSLGWISKSDSDSEYLKDFYNLEIKSHQGAIVGEYTLEF